MVKADVQAVASTPRRNIIRASVSCLVAILSLWIVAIATGLPDSGQSSRDLNVGIDLDPINPPSNSLAGAIRAREVFASVTLDSRAIAGAPPPFDLIFKTAKGPAAVSEGEANLSVSFWRDAKYTSPIHELSNSDHRLEFLLVSDREIQPMSDGNVSIRPITKEELAATSTVANRFSFGQPYLVTVADSPDLGPLLEKTLTYEIDLKFSHPLDGTKGLAQFEWHQSLRVMHSPDTTFGAVNRANFERRIDDVRTLAGAAVDQDPVVRTSYILTTVSEETEDTEAAAFVPLEVTIHGADTSRKDLVDFVVFGMAALFGAAAATLFESALSAVSEIRLKK